LKHEVKGFDRVYTRKMEKHTAEQLKEFKLEPKKQYHDEPVGKITNKKRVSLIRENKLQISKSSLKLGKTIN